MSLSRVAIVTIVNREARDPYQNIYNIKQALKKAYPEFVFPVEGDAAVAWETARKLAVEYHSAPTAEELEAAAGAADV